MIALLADPRLYEELDALRDGTELAAINFAQHFVGATTHADAAALEAVLDAKQVAFSRLPVSHAFHSRWIGEAEPSALRMFGEVEYWPPRIPLVCCAQTRMIPRIGAAHLWAAVPEPLLFSTTIARLESRAAHCYVDVGATGTLVTFLRRGRSPDMRARTVQILTPFGAGLRNYQTLTAGSDVTRRAALEHIRRDAPDLA